MLGDTFGLPFFISSVALLEVVEEVVAEVW